MIKNILIKQMNGISLKKISVILAFVFALSISSTHIVCANMAAPKEADVGSTITFEKNDTISVLSEVLDITVDKEKAYIVAKYNMKNTTDQSISTQSMFLSPNIEYSNVNVMVNNIEVDYVSESYSLNYDTEIEIVDWQYVVLTDDKIASNSIEQKVDTITFNMDFLPNQEYEVIVSYTYKLGGYPNNEYNAKEGIIEYYLTPTSMWNDFNNLTINLYLDNQMPVIKSSNIEFEELDKGVYQYVSNSLLNENLKIVIDENWFQNIISTLKSPYFLMVIMMFSPFVIIPLLVILLVIFIRRKKRNKAK